MRQALAILLLLLGLAWATAAHAQVAPSPADTVPRFSTGTSTVQTITGVQFGSAFSGRVIVAFIGCDSSTQPTITIGGVAATVSGSAANGLIASAIVPTGTSGNIVITGTAMTFAGNYGAYQLAGAADANQFDAASGAGTSQNVDSPANGAIVALSTSASSGTWTGATQDWLDTSSGFIATGASFANSSAVTARLISYSTGTGLFAASFSPSGSPPPSTLHMIPLLGVGK